MIGDEGWAETVGGRIRRSTVEVVGEERNGVL